ncbi:hypothetical protein COBT_002590 [Conglomerata obtusa]
MSESANFQIVKSEQPFGEVDESRGIILNAKPIAIQRRVFFQRGPGGIPMIKEIIIVETEASLSRVLLVIFTLFIYALLCQIFFSIWNRYHSKSYRATVTFLLYAFPPLCSIFLGDFIFFAVCFLFNIVIAKIIFNIMKKPMRTDVPKNTYRFFRALYRSTTIGSIIGQAAVVVGFLSSTPTILVIGIFVLFFSLYFGLLTRESIEFISEKMAMNLGYYSKEGVPERKAANNVCAICDEITETKNVRLTCNHVFHIDCLQGWVFMGKKGFCPCCRENVNFDNFEVDKWQKGENMYSLLIDFLRRAIVFVAFFALFTFLYKIKPST